MSDWLTGPGMPDRWNQTPLSIRIAFCLCAGMILYLAFQPAIDWLIVGAATDTGFHP